MSKVLITGHEAHIARTMLAILGSARALEIDPEPMKISIPDELAKACPHFYDFGPKRRGKHHGRNPGAFGKKKL